MLTNSQSMEETNTILENQGLPSYNDSFVITFRIKKKHFFEVTFGSTKAHGQQPYFATSGSILNHTRSDYKNCGQCQVRVLQKGSVAKKFYDKWDTLHCKSLTMEQYNELLIDLAELKIQYPHIDNDGFNSIVKFDREMSK